MKVMKAYYRELHGLNALIDHFVGDPAPRRDALDDADWRRAYDLPDDPYEYIDQLSYMKR
jgi:hypothetical protein